MKQERIVQVETSKNSSNYIKQLDYVYWQEAREVLTGLGLSDGWKESPAHFVTMRLIRLNDLEIEMASYSDVRGKYSVSGVMKMPTKESADDFMQAKFEDSENVFVAAE